MKKKIWIASGAVVLLIIVVIFSVKATHKDEVLVQSSKVQRKDVLTSKVTASGEIRAKDSVDVQSEIAGIITDLPVHEGDTLKKGDVLLRIDPIQTDADAHASRAQYEARLAETRAQEFEIMNSQASLARDESSLLSARAELEQAENNFARSQNSFKRKQQLNEDGLISREDYETAQNEFKSVKSQLEITRSKVAQMETNVRIAKINIEHMKTNAGAQQANTKAAMANLTKMSDQQKKTTLYAPLSGVITQLLVEIGERAQPGIMSNPQATLMTIADLNVIQAEIKVDETDVVSLALGNLAKVKVDAIPDVAFDGQVTEIGNSPIQSTSTQEAKDFKVIITLKNPSPKLRPGMSCTGEITTNTKHNVLTIPIQALTVRDVEVDKDGKYHEPDLTKKKKERVVQANSSKDKVQKKELEGVFVINKNMIARFRPVTTGITGESEMEVLDKLNEGEEIVLGSFQTLRTIKDGAAVKIDNSAKSQSEKKS